MHPTFRSTSAVPERDDRHFGMMGVIAKDTERRFAEREMLPIDHWQPDPPHAECRPKLTVRKECDVSV